MDNNRVAVIGGGPAGMMAAAIAAKRGKKVILIEKNNRPGKKLLITGKGRCNITNSAPIEDFIKNVPVNGNFLYSAFYGFTNEMLVSLLNKLGLETKVERGGRVFPVSDRAGDVLAALEKLMRLCGVRVLKAEALDVGVSENGTKLVYLSGNKRIECDSLIIATGGASYPLTGSTGDGYRFALKLGHSITDVCPSLVPLELSDGGYKQLMGLSLKNIAVRITDGKREVYSDFGEMLFTHFGASGPVILSASSHMKNPAKHSYVLSVDLKPALDFQALDKRILRDFEQQKNKAFSNSLGMLLPKKMIPVIVSRSGIPADMRVNEITRTQRRALAEIIKNLTFTVSGFRPVSEAIVTSGGISVKEINPSTMESKLVHGVFFAGEVIDVDAYTGGFNLQIAFSTGFLAGKNA